MFMRKRLTFWLIFLMAGAAWAGEGQNLIYRMTIDGVINPASAEFVQKGIAKATEDSARCLVIEMDTPGGLMKSMNIIVKSILSSEVPVVVYVSPGGSHCASAGVFIMMAAHVAAMSPGTNIGAAHPVTIGGGADSASSAMMEKVTNDAVAFIRSIAQKNGRNADWAEDAVRKSVSVTETEALEKKVIDLIAPSFDSLLIKIHRREVETVLGKRVILTSNPQIVKIERSWRFALLDILTDPNIAYILMMLGIYGLFFELYNPGSIVPGVVGGICLILAFYSFQTIPINFAGLALIIFAVILFLLEIKVTSYGVLTIGGVVSLLLGSLMLIDSPDDMIRLSYSVVIPIVVITAVFFLVIIGYGIKAQTRKVSTGSESMAGMIGEVIEKIEPGKTGKISVHGEIWKAVSDSPLEIHDRVRVIRMNQLLLTVEKI